MRKFLEHRPASRHVAGVVVRERQVRADAMARARSAAAQATAINPDLAEAHTARGWIAFYHDWNWVESENRFMRALQINSADFSAHVGLAHLLSNTGRHEAALRQIEQALAVEPTSPLARALRAQFLFYATL